MTANRPKSNAIDVADYVVSFFQKHGDPISNLKLQKLLYYAEGWHLALHNKQLFSDQIEAWPRGPVVYGAWKKYSEFQWKPITRRVHADFVGEHVDRHLKEVIRVYGNFSAYALEDMTHQEPPWMEARAGLQPDARSNRPISRETMKAFFAQQAVGA